MVHFAGIFNTDCCLTEIFESLDTEYNWKMVFHSSVNVKLLHYSLFQVMSSRTNVFLWSSFTRRRQKRLGQKCWSMFQVLIMISWS